MNKSEKLLLTGTLAIVFLTLWIITGDLLSEIGAFISLGVLLTLMILS